MTNRKLKTITTADLAYSRVGSRYWQVARSNIPDHCSYKSHVVKYVSKLEQNITQGIGLLLHGKYSSGKTGAGVIILKAFIAHKRTTLFVAARELCSASIDKTVFDIETGQTLINRARTVECLLIDDLGDEAEQKSDYVPALIEGIIRTRSDRRLVTIITTNLSMKALSDRYGVSTMAVMKGCIVPIEVAGFDWRTLEGKRALDGLDLK